MKLSGFYSLIFILALFSEISAQSKNPLTIDYGVAMYSRHYFRGTILGNAPTIEPELSISKGKFNLCLWGASTFNSSYEEIDLIITYSPVTSLNFTIYDYFNPVDGAENSFFNYKKKDLRHTIEFTAEYDNDDIPFGMLGGVFLFGDIDTVTLKERYSVYLEPRYKFMIAGKEFSLFAGFTPHKSYYADKAFLINTGINMEEVFSLNDRFEIPVGFTFFANPYSKGASFSVTAGLRTRQE